MDGRDWLDKFTRAQAALRDSSVRVYASWWARYLAFLEARGAAVCSADTEEVSAFLAQYQGNTAIRYFRLLQRVYAFALSKGWVPHNPADALQGQFLREEARVKIVAPGPEHLRALHRPLAQDAPWRHVRNRALALLCVEAGPRQGELSRLTWQDLSLDENAAPSVRWRQARQERTVALSDCTAALLSRWRTMTPAAADSTVVFRDLNGTAPLAPSTCWRILGSELAALGLVQPPRGAVGTQVLRAALTARLSGQAPLEEVQKQLGHRQLSSTVDLLSRVVIAPDKQ